MSPQDIHVGEEVIAVEWSSYSREPKIVAGKVASVEQERLGASSEWQVTILAPNRYAALRPHKFTPEHVFLNGSDAGAFIAREAAARIQQLQQFVDDPLHQLRH